MLKRLFLSLSILLCGISFAQTSVSKSGNQWILEVSNEPYDIKGVTIGFDKDVENYDVYFKDLQSLGVNTVRTWATNDDTELLLDSAEKHGIKVMVGIWMRHGRPGMEDDDRFNYLEDNEGMEAMYNTAMDVVDSYKDHPAVLMWGVGNEVYLNTATDAEKKAYSLFLERVCSNIKQRDPDHLISSVEAWTFGLDWWETYVPSLDIYGINSYGYGANMISAEFKKKAVDKPYMITEFGVTGEWDIQAEKNGIKIEPSDQEKYEMIANSYNDWFKEKPDCLGVFVFHYSDGQDHLAPWLLTHYNGSYRPQYWAIRKAYTGKDPLNNVPVIATFNLPEDNFESGSWVPVTLEVTDKENEALSFSFSYNQRTGSRKRRDQINPLQFRGNYNDGFEIQLPNEHGTIKVYVMAKDEFNNMGIASNSIMVKDEDAAKRKFLVPKMSMPFYVYQDSENMPYAPSGYMGNYKDMEVDVAYTGDAYSGKTSVRIKYNAKGNWYGIGFMDPANDWGDILGGYDLTGAKTFSFWARSKFDGVRVRVGFGLIDKDKPYYDTAKKMEEITLTSEWQQYTIKIKRMDLSCIRTGFVLFSSSDGFKQEIYLDDIVFE